MNIFLFKCLFKTSSKPPYKDTVKVAKKFHIFLSYCSCAENYPYVCVNIIQTKRKARLANETSVIKTLTGIPLRHNKDTYIVCGKSFLFVRT